MQDSQIQIQVENIIKYILHEYHTHLNTAPKYASGAVPYRYIG